MKLPNIFTLFAKEKPRKYAGVADFLRTASEEEKSRVFYKAAEMANAEQQSLVEKAR